MPIYYLSYAARQNTGNTNTAQQINYLGVTLSKYIKHQLNKN